MSKDRRSSPGLSPVLFFYNFNYHKLGLLLLLPLSSLSLVIIDLLFLLIFNRHIKSGYGKYPNRNY